MSVRPLKTPTSEIVFPISAKGLTTQARFEYTGELDAVNEAAVLVHGFRSPARAKQRRALAEAGMPALSFKLPDAKYMGLFGNTIEIHARLAANAADILGNIGVSSVNLAGHSLGGVIVATATPMVEQVDRASVVYEASAGFTDESFIDKAKKLGICGLAEVHPRNFMLLPTLGHIIYKGVSNPVHTLVEGAEGHRFKGRAAVERLDQQGFSQAMVEYEDDLVFHPKLVDAGGGGLPKTRIILTKEDLKEACHLAPYHDPEGAARGLARAIQLMRFQETESYPRAS